MTSIGAARRPRVALTARDVDDGLVAAKHAAAAAHGGVFRSNVPTGRLAGPCVVVVGSDALALVTGDARESLSSERGWQPLLGTRFGRAVLNVDEPQHMLDRRRWAGALSPSMLARYLPAMRSLVRGRVERWASQHAFDPYAAARELAFAVVATTLGGFDDDAVLARVLALLSPVLDPPGEGESPLDQHHRVAPLRDELEAILRAQLARARDARRASPSLIAQLRADDPALSPDALLTHLNLVLITGHETTASLIAWLLYEAATEDRLAWLREELGAFPLETGSPEELAALPRLDAFVQETGRLHPPLVCAPRIALRDCELAGERIEAGARVVLGLGGTNLLASSYDEPLAFRPERWLGSPLPRPATFGTGHRSCLGMRFARIEAKVTLAHLITHFDIERLPGAAPINAGFWNARPCALPRLALHALSGS